MKVVDIVKDASKMLCIKEVIDSIENNELDNEELQYMLLAVNVVNNNIASNYIEVLNSCKASTNTGIIKFSEVSSNDIIEIKSVTSVKDNSEASYSVKCDGIHVENGEYEIEYSYFPNEVTLDSVIDYYTKINKKLFAQGVVAEYLFLKGDIEDAYVWDKRFKQNLIGATRVRRSIVMPKRRWS